MAISDERATTIITEAAHQQRTCAERITTAHPPVIPAVPAATVPPSRPAHGQAFVALFDLGDLCIHCGMDIDAGQSVQYYCTGPGNRSLVHEADRIAGRVCESCAATARAAHNHAAAEANAAAGLPTLTGSPSQVVWAESIRASLGGLTPDSIRALGVTQGAPETDIGSAVATIAGWRAQTRAAWWIDNRSVVERAVHRFAVHSAREYVDRMIPVLMGYPQ